MVFEKGHKPYLRKDKTEDEKMFGKKQEEKVKTFVEGKEVGELAVPVPPQPPPQEAPPEPTTRYVEANLQLAKLPATLLLKIEVYGDTIPVVLKIDEFGNVNGVIG